MQLTRNPEAIFRIPVLLSNEKAHEIIDLIYGIRIDSITHSIMVEAAYPQTGMTGAGHFIAPDSLTARQANFTDIVSVDPIAETESFEGEPIALTDDLTTPEKLAMDEDPVETTDSEKNADSNADDVASGSWDD